LSFRVRFKKNINKEILLTMNKKTILVSAFIFFCILSNAQNVGSSPEYIEALTSEWKGDDLLMGDRRYQMLFLKD